MSGNASGFINSPVGTVSAKASTGNGDREEKPNRPVASARVAVVRQNSRRVICKGISWALPVKFGVFASWTAQLWQCRAHLPRRLDGDRKSTRLNSSHM